MAGKGKMMKWMRLVMMGGWMLLIWGAMNGDALTDAEKQEGFESLFNGKDFSGCKIMGKAEGWEIVEEAIHAIPGKNGYYIRGERDFEDFILRLEYKTGANANSGVFIHAPEYGRQSRVGGEIQIFDSYGKEPTPNSAGAIYDVLAPRVTASRPTGEWNDLEIHYEYPQIKVTLNNQVVQDVDIRHDDRLRWRIRKGPFGLQEHGNNAWFRNIRVKDLGGDDTASWESLFNGVDLSGWKMEGQAKWSVKKPGVTIQIKDTRGADITQWNAKLATQDFDLWKQLGNAKIKFNEATIAGADRPGVLISEKRYNDFQLWAYVKAGVDAEGGLSFHWNGRDDPGYEVKILNDSKDPNKTGSLVGLAPAEGLYAQDAGWFPLQIAVQGQQGWFIVNGKVVAKYDKLEEKEGNIVLRIDSRSSKILFKDIRIQELKP